MKNKSVRILCQIALLAALAIVARSVLSPLIPGLGRINTSFVFSQLVPILFGPIAGGLSNAVIDTTSYFIAWQGFGGFMVHLFAIEVFAGIGLGLMWKFVKIPNKLAKLFVVILTVDIIYTILNTIGLMWVGFLPAGSAFHLIIWPRLGLAASVAIPKIFIMYTLINIYEKYIRKEKL